MRESAIGISCDRAAEWHSFEARTGRKPPATYGVRMGTRYRLADG